MAQEVSIIIKAIDNATKTLGGIGKGFTSLSDKIRAHEATFKNMSISGGIAFATLSAGIWRSISSAKESEQVTAQLNSVLESTKGIAGLTAKAIEDHASALQRTLGISDEVIMSGQNMLLTFTNIGKNVFPRATETLLDMATAMNGGATPGAEQLSNSAIQLGKALNDPIAGISALSRVGVQFTKDQEDMIKGMVKMGDVAGAQKIILDELDRQFGGSAKKQAETFDGAMRKLQLTVDDVFETLGTNMIPTIQKLTEAISPVVFRLSDWISKNPQLASNLVLVATAVAGVVTAIGGLGLVLPSITTGIGALATVIGAIGWPITLVIAGVGLLATAWATNFGGIQEKTKLAFDTISSVFSAFVELFKGNFQGFSEGIMNATINLFEGVKNLFPGFYEGFKGLWESIENVTAKIIAKIVVYVLDKLLTIRNALQAMRDALTEIATLGQAKTKTFNGGDSPAKNADGGSMSSGSPRIVGEYGPELFVPDRMGTIMNQRQMAQSGIGGNTISINFGGVTIAGEADENRLVDKIKTALIRENELYRKGIA